MGILSSDPKRVEQTTQYLTSTMNRLHTSINSLSGYILWNENPTTITPRHKSADISTDADIHRPAYFGSDKSADRENVRVKKIFVLLLL